MPVKSKFCGSVLVACLLGSVLGGSGYAAESQAVQLPANASDSLLDEADAAYHAGRLDDARRWLEQAVQDRPRSARAHALLGLVLARQNDAQGALQNLRQANEFEPRNSDYAYDYALLLLQNGQFRPAIPILESLHQKSPRSDDVLVNLARAYVEAGDTQKLSDMVGGLPDSSYDNMSLLQTLATVLAGAGAASAVAGLWQAAIHHDPNQPLPYAGLAELWIGQGQPGQALALLEKAPAAARGPVYLYVYGDAQMALRDYQKAVPVFLDLTRRSPDDQGPWEKLVRCDLLSGRLAEAEQAAAQAALRFPGVKEFPYQQAVADYLLGRSAEAVDILKPLLDKAERGDTRPILLMAVLKSQNGDYQLALNYFERAEQMQAGCNALASYFYGATLLRMHRLAEAQAKLQAAIECHPRFALAEFRLGEALSQDGKLPEAVNALERAAHDDPALAEPYYALAQIRERQGDAAGARQALAQFNRLKSNGSGSERGLLAGGLP